MSAFSNTVSKSNLGHLLELEEALARASAKFGLELKRSPHSLPDHILQLNAASFQPIQNNLYSLLQVFEKCLEEQTDPWDDKEFFRISMQQLGLTYPPDFLDFVGHGDLVEGFDLNRFQIFRNMRYMEMASYSLLEILSYEWPMLYDRPVTITEKMISYCEEILWTANRTIPFTIQPHFIREMRSEKRGVFEVNFKYLAPLFSGPGRPAGMLGTYRATQISIEAGTRDNVSFL